MIFMLFLQNIISSIIYFFYPYRVLKKLSLPAEFISRQELREAIENPIIVHYLGEERPWRKGNTHKLRSTIFIILKRHLGLKRLWKLVGNYFICFRTFNIIMKPFPMLRYKIINSLIPAFMKYRKKQLQKNKR